LVFLLVAGTEGCLERPKPIEVTGSLMHRGQPVTNAAIIFNPGKGKASWAYTDDEGRFRLVYDRRPEGDSIYGALTGKHHVYIRWKPKDPEEEGNRDKILSREMEDFFQRYSGMTSPVEVEVSKNSHEFNFNWD
jgi:hypothetical protein